MLKAKEAFMSCRPKPTLADVKKRLPILQWLPLYNLRKLQADLVAGLAVGLMIIPQSLAHATIAGLKPQYGLYSSFAAMFFYVFLGTSKDVSVGTTVITGLLTSRYSITETTNPEIASALAFLVGIVLIVVAVFRLSFVVRFLSFPVISGFVSASAIIISTSQLRNLFGLAKPPRMIFLKLKHFFENIKHTRPADVTMGFLCLIFLFSFQHLANRKWNVHSGTSKWRRYAIKVIRVVGIGRNAVIAILAILVSYTFYCVNLGDLFRTVGELPPGLPKFKMPLKSIAISSNETLEVKDLISGYGSGLGILPLIILIQVIAASKALARKSKYKIDPFQEILAVGVGNVFASFFNSFSLTASFSRSAINNMSGAKSPISGVVTSIIVILAIEFVSPLFRYVPMSSLAAIVIAAVVNLIDHRLARKLWRTNKIDFVVWIVTFCGCLYEIEIGIMVGVIVSIAVVFYREVNPRLNLNIERETKTLTVALKGGVWFTGIEAVANKIAGVLEKEDKGIKEVVIDCKHMLEIDYTVIHGLTEIIADCKLVNVEVRFVNAEDNKVRKHLEDAGLKSSPHACEDETGRLISNGEINQNEMKETPTIKAKEEPIVDSVDSAV